MASSNSRASAKCRFSVRHKLRGISLLILLHLRSGGASVVEIRWERFPLLKQHPRASMWFSIQARLGLAANTIEAYGRALEAFLRFSAESAGEIDTTTREQLSLYVRSLMERTLPVKAKDNSTILNVGLSNSTMQQRLTALRLYFDYLIEEGLRTDNPVGRGRYTPGKVFGSQTQRGLLPRFHKLPWIPSDEQWETLLGIVNTEPLRNRLMFAFAYDAALRREELCSLQTGDIDPSQRLLRIRAATTKNRRERVVPYSVAAGSLLAIYLAERRLLTRASGTLFVSYSRRNRSSPISIWTWSKVIKAIAERAQLPRFTTHTLRHLCLTDLARAGWELQEIATLSDGLRQMRFLSAQRLQPGAIAGSQNQPATNDGRNSLV